MKARIIGLVIFVVVAAAAVAIYLLGSVPGSAQRGPAITVKGYIGGEKVGLFNDPEVQKILKDKYGITVDATKAGSIEMVTGKTDGLDFLFPSSQTAMELFTTAGKAATAKEKIMSSPIVFFSWSDVAAALEKEGIVQKRNGIAYVVDLPKLIGYIKSGKKWSDIGLNIYGPIKVISTDPVKSNSGNMYAALLANTLNGGNVVDESTLGSVLPDVQSIFGKLGQMESSSANLFSRYLTLGMGDSPIIAGYENQIIEFALENPALWEKAKSSVAILYPEPTIYSEHYFIALDENGKRLCDALLDEQIQKLAWEKHGFRTGMISSATDSAIINGIGIPDTIAQIMPMPKASVMQKIIDALSN